MKAVVHTALVPDLRELSNLDFVSKVDPTRQRSGSSFLKIDWILFRSLETFEETWDGCICIAQQSHDLSHTPCRDLLHANRLHGPKPSQGRFHFREPVTSQKSGHIKIGLLCTHWKWSVTAVFEEEHGHPRGQSIHFDFFQGLQRSKEHMNKDSPSPEKLRVVDTQDARRTRRKLCFT